MFLASRVFMGTPTKISSFKYFKFMGKAMIQPLVAIKYHSLHYYSLLLHFLVILFFSVFGNCMGGTLFEPGGRVRAPALYDSATIIRTSGYDILEESEGESSTIFHFRNHPDHKSDQHRLCTESSSSKSSRWKKHCEYQSLARNSRYVSFRDCFRSQSKRKSDWK